MNRVCWWLVDLASRTLEPTERIAVQGDLLESGQNGASALRDVLGLVIRRQLALWKSWQPWLALLGVAGISAVVLSERSSNLFVGTDLQLRTYLKYGVHYGTGVTLGQDVVFLLCLTLALFAWSWISGFVLAALSGRALWITATLFYLVAFDSFRARLVLSGRFAANPSAPFFLIALSWLIPFNPANLVFLFTAIWGAHSGLRNRTLRFGRAFLLAASVSILTALLTWTSGWYETAHEVWSGGVWHGVAWPVRLLPLALAGWPASYLLAASWFQKANSVHSKG